MRFKYLDFLGVMMNFIGAHGCLELLFCWVFCIVCCSRVDVTNLKICVCIYHLLQWQDMEEGKVSSHHDLLSIMISTVD